MNAGAGMEDEYAAALADIIRTVPPVEIVGEAGDVVLWHQRSESPFERASTSHEATAQPLLTVWRGRRGMCWCCAVVHSGGVNRTADRPAALGGPAIRVVVACDFQKDGLTLIEGPQTKPGPNHWWWVHARQFEEDRFLDADHMWEDWGI